MGRLNNVMMREMASFLGDYWKPKMTVLDVGSWCKAEYRTFRELVPSGYFGIDIQDGLNVDLVVEPYHWPFDDNSFDLVISGDTLEHTERFWDVFKEMARIARIALCIIAPFHYPKIHRHPVDCWRFLPDGMKVLADLCGDIELVRAYIKPNKCIGIFKKGKK